jgi:aspartate/tyrosine/aromatic aminotransferase
MFETIQAAPPDSILGLTDAFKKDPNPNKINLGVGVYKNESGLTPILDSVKQAETYLLAHEASKTYLPINGIPEFISATQSMLFGPDHEILTSGRAVTAQTPGGTGALRVAADFIVAMMPGKRIWMSTPTWANHPHVFTSAGLEMASYPYLDPETRSVDFAAMLAALKSIPEGDIILLHACCHNPTGADLALEQWEQVAAVVQERSLLPLLDFAYQGFAEGLNEDAAGLRLLASSGVDMIVASSYSKNFGLYDERVGAVTMVTRDADVAAAVLSQVKKRIRANYSNPPAHGGYIVSTVLNDPELRAQWEGEVTAMRNRVRDMRHLMAETLNEKGVEQDFSFITRQRGMFSYSGLTPEQVAVLRDKHSIYIVGSGRINVAGLTPDNMDYLCDAIADVLGA